MLPCIFFLLSAKWEPAHKLLLGKLQTTNLVVMLCVPWITFNNLDDNQTSEPEEFFFNIIM